jgi:hypothetical protein
MEPGTTRAQLASEPSERFVPGASPQEVPLPPDLEPDELLE